MPTSLTIQQLRDAVARSAAAFRCMTEYQPAGGPGDKVFPPTYEGGKYATEKRYIPDPQDPGDLSKSRVADCVLLDSVQSQANRMELALLDAWEAGRIDLPVIVVDFSDKRLEKTLRVTSLDAPHRIADAILRDSCAGNGDEPAPFRKSECGQRLDHVDLRNATPLLEMCPTALVFGMWDSTGPKGGLGAKFQRALVSEIVGYDAVPGVRTSSRIDPLGIQKDEQTTIYKASDGELGWRLNDNAAAKAKETLVKIGDGKPSEINHGNITPAINDGGFTISKAVQTTTLSLPALRRLHFPPTPGEVATTEVNNAARTALAALGLCAATLAREAGCDLRSRCQLVATTPFKWELLDRPGEEEHKRFTLAADDAVRLLKEAIADLGRHLADAAKEWKKDAAITLTPSDELLELVVRSQKLATAGKGESGDAGE